MFITGLITTVTFASVMMLIAANFIAEHPLLRVPARYDVATHVTALLTAFLITGAGVFLTLDNMPHGWNMRLTSDGICISVLILSGLLVTGYRRLSDRPSR